MDKRNRKKRGGMATLGEALQDYLSATGLGNQLREGAVFEAWRTALGDALGRRAKAVAFRRGELVVEVESSAHLQELKNFTGEQYRVAANKHLGAARIERVAYKLKR